MAKVILIHGWDGSPTAGFRPWLKKELESRGHQVLAPAMPTPRHPKLNDWLATLHQTIGVPSGDTLIVGHSLGCLATLRYLESLSSGQQIGAAFLVAGFITHLGIPEMIDFADPYLDWEKIKSSSKQLSLIYSDNDFYVSRHYAELVFKPALNPHMIFAPGMQHFSEDDGIFQVDEILDECLRLIDGFDPA